MIDRLVLVDVPSIWDAHGIHHEEEAGHEEHADDEEHAHHEEQEAHEEHAGEGGMAPEITAILVKYRSAFGAVSVPGMINRQTDMQAAVPAVETARLLGLLLGHAALALAIGTFDTLREAGISAWLLHPGELAIVAAVLGIALLAALIPAIRVIRTDLAVSLARVR